MVNKEKAPQIFYENRDPNLPAVLPLILPYRDLLPKIHPEAFIAPGVIIIGDVTIGAKSSIWFGSIIRGDVNYIRIGEATNIQDGCLLHVSSHQNPYPLIIKDRVTIAHVVILHGCTIESDCLIGVGAIVLDGAYIGQNCLVAAGSLVTESSEIPPNSLVVGTPAKVKRGRS